MTFLELCQALSREAGLPGSGPSAVTGQTGEHGRLVAWIRDAWTEIQTKRENWNFLRGRDEFDTVASTNAYLPQSSGNDVVLQDSFVSCYLASAGLSDEKRLAPVHWDDFNGRYNIGDVDEGRPTMFTINPAGQYVLYPTPDAVYTIGFDFTSLPVELTNSTDTPAIPERHHMTIVYLALTYYAEYEDDMSLYQVAQQQFNRRINRLEREYMPQLRVNASALA